MRPLPLALAAAAALIAAAGHAQPAQQPAPQSPATSAPTLNERIDGAATLNGSRSTHDAGPLAEPLARGAKVTSPATRALEAAGRPRGTPLGTDAAPGPAATPGAATGGDPRQPG